ncbi:MAG TPA: hypothetical protein VIQ54_20150 [Polyangia bacterium]
MAAGLGFGAYVYVVPYSKMERAVGGNQSAIADERRAAEAAIAEREKLKADVEKYKAAAAEKKSSDDKHRGTIDTMATSLKPGLEALGATLAPTDGALGISFPSAKLIDANGIDVSDGGMAAIKIIGEAAKRESAKIRIRARSSAAAPPKELRSLFRTAGEMNAVRAARVMSSLEHAGVAPARITIIGDVEKGGAARAPRGKKGGAAPSDRVELEIEPE